MKLLLHDAASLAAVTMRKSCQTASALLVACDAECIAENSPKCRCMSTGGRCQPFYHVLVDSRHRPGQTTYAAQVMDLFGVCDHLSFLSCVR